MKRKTNYRIFFEKVTQKTLELMGKERTRFFSACVERKTTRFNLQKRSSQSGFLCIKKQY